MFILRFGLSHPVHLDTCFGHLLVLLLCFLCKHTKLGWLLVSDVVLSNKLACEPELIQPTTPYQPLSNLDTPSFSDENQRNPSHHY